MTTFIDEMLAEHDEGREQRLIEMDRLRADQLLMAIAKFETNIADANKLADDEVKLIEEYRQREVGRLDKKVSWLVWNLENFMRNIGEKTINLPHGSLKLRLGRDQVEVVDMELFLKVAGPKGLLRAVPESFKPDMKALTAQIKTTGEIPPGVAVTAATTKFSYSTIKGESNGEQAKAGTAAEHSDETEAVESKTV